jgi:hypothetical protein
MNLTLNQGGLSARRKTFDNPNVTYFGTPVSAILLSVSLLLSSCQEKTSGQIHERKKASAATVNDSLKPKVNINVNRHFDDKGNVIGFDSTYTSFYSNLEGDTASMDKLMKSFDQHFNSGYSSFFRNEFNSLFFNDSLRYPDFFHNDFFIKRYELNDQYLRNMMGRMDSIKNQFYQERSETEKGKQPKEL